VCLSKERIGSPLISHPDVLIAMNEISLRKFVGSVPPGGLILYNGICIPPDLGPVQARVICVPASSIADKIGYAKVANMVLLGALLAAVDCLAASTALAVIQAKTGKSALLEANRKALEEGRRLIEEPSQVAALR
jgi:Pyruvate/2-oxoacid:ferredoxin oxidoreductase gamma subunit